jgi:penicillin amidase
MPHRWLFALTFTLGISLAGFAQTAEPQETVDSLRSKAKAVLSQLEGELALPGLQQPVEVLRDQWGIAHIYAANDHDLFFAQGFVVAQDRLFQLDLWRRTAIGETAALVGERGLEGDRFARLMKYRGPAEAEWTSYAPDARKIAEAFVAGINAAIDSMQDRLPIEFQLLNYKPARWRPEDILGRMSGLIMVRNYDDEVGRAELVSLVGVEKARRLCPTDPVRPFAPVPELDLAGIDQTLLAGYKAAVAALPIEPTRGGSNNWAVTGSRSASGQPLLAGDPHRPLLLPSLRYMVHLNAPGWNVIGAGEPALPGVAIGHNDHVAWAFTIVNTDQADLYVEETNPADPTQYKVGDMWQPMEIVREKATVRGKAEPVELELRFTRHGPVIHEDPTRNRAYVMRWVGSEPGAAAYLASLRLDRVQSAKEFVKELAHWKIPALNMVYADVDGNIGWVASGGVPIRDGWDGLLPVPGAKGKYEWRGFLPVAELPQAHNPDVGYVATANHNILPDGYKNLISYEWSSPYRYEQIKRRLDAQPKFTLDDFRSIQHDATSIPGQTLVGLLKAIDASSPELRAVDAECVKLLAAWDGVLSIDSRAGVLHGYWCEELADDFYSPAVPRKVLGFTKRRGGTPTMLRALVSADPAWFGSDDPQRARDRLLASTLGKAVAKAKQKFPDYPRSGTWGELHTTQFTHRLAPLGPEYARAFSLGPVPKSGDGHTPNAASHDDQFRQTGGASYRQVFDLADWDRGLATNVPGQSGQPGSPHYDDLLPKWAREEYIPLAFSRAKVESVTQHRLSLQPATKR